MRERMGYDRGRIRQRKIAVQVVRCRDDRVGGIVYAADNCFLPSEKEKAGVFVDRAANGSAELVALEWIDLIRKIVACVEGPIPNKFKKIAMKLVGSCFRYDVYHRSGIVAILRVEAVGLDAE